MEQYEHFLYAIGSVFGPLFAIVLSDFYLFKNRTIDPNLMLQLNGAIAWVIGVATYYGFQALAWPIGAVLPAMVATATIYTVGKKVMPELKITRN